VRLATLRRGATTVAVRLDDGIAVEIPGHRDVGSLLGDPEWDAVARAADGARHDVGSLEPAAWAPPVLRPAKIICVGLNYRNHIREMGRELPTYPTLFAKFPEALIGPHDPIALPAHAADTVDWEGEVAVVLGARARRLTAAQAERAIAGYTVINDVTVREHQYRTSQWLQGKTFESTTPFGPWLTSGPLAGELRTEVDGEVVQQVDVGDMVFGPAELVAYISQILTLLPGDVIATGTPGGVGHARTPPRYLTAGQTLVTSVAGLGTLTNVVVDEG
jgi:acylpyruvate hydrolase